ncbi:hypothetical protein PUNSTDRAFT_131898 [Punctularia strigosozonata HHB-11173 SS5]|uniref:uncharacterized protein n=1 Tax=Punctularia strigosozonata (strain HHB-11173) TaxID=741275 RepID=UPI00044166B6|nr:uncharacterized protein PUNSTDRAFT_131898 [Punctularia strigosozonata HHB-11173 SS5]EIN11743.1 hypothetical protein PUNSTDRAFT_131898 [Punctularia strigosozonata HHB-11173 SS5]
MAQGTGLGRVMPLSEQLREYGSGDGVSPAIYVSLQRCAGFGYVCYTVVYGVMWHFASHSDRNSSTTASGFSQSARRDAPLRRPPLKTRRPPAAQARLPHRPRHIRQCCRPITKRVGDAPRGMPTAGLSRDQRARNARGGMPAKRHAVSTSTAEDPSPLVLQEHGAPFDRHPLTSSTAQASSGIAIPEEACRPRRTLFRPAPPKDPSPPRSAGARRPIRRQWARIDQNSRGTRESCTTDREPSRPRPSSSATAAVQHRPTARLTLTMTQKHNGDLGEYQLRLAQVDVYIVMQRQSGVKVLLLEAGGANEDVLNIDVPQLCVTLTPSAPWDWNYTTPQVHLENRTLPFPRGIGLGGTSAVNCLVYTCGTKSDIDMWAALSGEEDWSWDVVLPYFKKAKPYRPRKQTHHSPPLPERCLPDAGDRPLLFNLPVGCVSPSSRGSVTINSSDPFAPPLINPNLLADELDLSGYIVRQGLKAGMRYLAAPAWDSYFVRPLQNLTTDEQFDAYIREHVVSFVKASEDTVHGYLTARER